MLQWKVQQKNWLRSVVSSQRQTAAEIEVLGRVSQARCHGTINNRMSSSVKDKLPLGPRLQLRHIQ